MSSMQPPPPVKVPTAVNAGAPPIVVEADRPQAERGPGDENGGQGQMCNWVLAGTILFTVYFYWNSLFGWNNSPNPKFWEIPFDFNSGLPVTWRNQQYSHGWLIPIITVSLLAFRWKRLQAPSTLERWAAVGLIMMTVAARAMFAKYHMRTPDMYTFVPMIAWAFVMAGGFRTLKWAAAPTAFLIFMFPLSMTGERMTLLPLKSVATQCSVFILQTMGIEATAEGNAIKLAEQSLEVADACSGLRMLTIFLALAAAAIMVLELPLWKQIIVGLSAVPIALAVNIIRIVVTAVLYVMVVNSNSLNAERIEAWSHDMAGWLMIPMALGMLFAELQILDRIVVDEDDQPLDVGLGQTGLPI